MKGIHQRGNKVAPAQAARTLRHYFFEQHLTLCITAQITMKWNAAEITAQFHAQRLQVKNCFWHQDKSHSCIMGLTASLVYLAAMPLLGQSYGCHQSGDTCAENGYIHGLAPHSVWQILHYAKTEKVRAALAECSIH